MDASQKQTSMRVKREAVQTLTTQGGGCRQSLAALPTLTRKTTLLLLEYLAQTSLGTVWVTHCHITLINTLIDTRWITQFTKDIRKKMLWLRRAVLLPARSSAELVAKAKQRDKLSRQIFCIMRSVHLPGFILSHSMYHQALLLFVLFFNRHIWILQSHFMTRISA